MTEKELGKSQQPTIGDVRRAGTIQLKKGDLVSDISLRSTSGRVVDLAMEADERHLVLFFYPGDTVGQRYAELSGCTPEAREFRDTLTQFQELNASVFGINLNTPERQRQFVVREHLPFELLSDCFKQLVTLWGIPLWTSQSGEEFVSRFTVVVRKGRVISAIYDVTSVPGHVDSVLECARSLS
jgi:peroxiredoxin Q/BCP